MFISLRSVRRFLFAAGWLSLAAAGGSRSPARDSAWDLVERDPVRTQLVLQLVVTCSEPESIGGNEQSRDGKRTEIWPIIGGQFQGRGIRGTVVPGGGDFPVVRPDGVEVVDALYRLKTDDGVTIIIHNHGIAYPDAAPGQYRYRMTPEFIAPKGKYDWLNKSLYIATLTDVPPGMQLAKGPKENDRLIQVYRIG
jgi:hypothetical protein